MKLIVAIIHDRDQKKTAHALLSSGRQFTKVATTGGFLREGNVTLLLGVEDDDVDNVIELIRDNCRSREQYVNALPVEAAPGGAFLAAPVKVEVGGAVVFVMDVERFERC
jgi:uncharacterized protein YaaQ